MNETVIQFGSDKRLLGILTTPSSAAAPLACLLLNAGVVHRVGPHRLNVKLARMLAQRGIPSLRLDLSGLGDSAPVTGRTNFRDNQPVADLQTAMDLLERDKNIRRFVVVGICSGAVNAHAVALADPRVVGVLMFDGFMFPTTKTHLIGRWKRFQALSWRVRLLKLGLKLAAVFGRSKKAAGDGAPNHLSREQFATSMHTLVGRGVNVFVFYSGSFLEQHNYATQLQDAFRGESFLSHIRCEYRPHIDHTVTPIAAQRELLEEIGRWCEQLAGSAQDANAARPSAQAAQFRPVDNTT
jgi:pimeloyl-ACP methyl ester carboxylesterase